MLDQPDRAQVGVGVVNDLSCCFALRDVEMTALGGVGGELGSEEADVVLHLGGFWVVVRVVG